MIKTLRLQKSAPAELMLLFFNYLPKKELGIDHVKGKELSSDKGLGRLLRSHEEVLEAKGRLQRQGGAGRA